MHVSKGGKMKNCILILFIFSFSSIAFGNCSNNLRMIVQKRLGYAPTVLFPENKETFFSKKKDLLEIDLQRFGATRKEILENKLSPYSRKMMKAFENKVIEPEISGPLEIIWNGINTPSIVKNWIVNLSESAIFEIYLSNKYNVISKFEKDKKIPEEYVKKALLRRVKRGGFNNSEENIEYIQEDLSDPAFAKILKNRKLIIDIPFTYNPHGHYIHFFQIDLMIYILKSKGVGPSKVGEIYQWMGENKSYQSPSLEEVGTVSSLIEGWFTFFDSFESDFTQPERLNPIIKKYIGW